MGFQFSVSARNAALDALEVAIGELPTLDLRTGSKPADCAAGDTGTLLASIPCPADWLGAAASGAKTIAGTWQVAGIAAGTVAHFRVKKSGACHIQGSVTVTGGGGDMTLDDVVMAVGKTVSITGFTITAGGA